MSELTIEDWVFVGAETVLTHMSQEEIDTALQEAELIEFINH